MTNPKKPFKKIEGWIAVRTPEGRPHYINLKKGLSQWEYPQFSRQNQTKQTQFAKGAESQRL